MAFFYQIGLFLLACVFIPHALYQWLRHGKYGSNWRQRLGWDLPPDPPVDKKKIWVHAVSVGELKAVVSLIELLHDESTHWIVSCVTETGFAEAKRSLKVPHTFIYMPFDFKGVVRSVLRRWKPSLILISETDFWYNFLAQAKELHIPVSLVNGKISARSTKRLSWVPFFAHGLLNNIDLFCLQDEQYRQRFAQLGVPNEKMVVTGNLKWDITPPQNSEQPSDWGIDSSTFVIVVGSTHHNEEQKILASLKLHKNMKVLLVPRHPERFEGVRALVNQYDSAQVTLVDQMGILGKLYHLAGVVILGGSFVPGIGGHNIIEASQCGVPVLFGPYMDNQQDMVRRVLDAKAGVQCPLESLQSEVYHFFQNGDYRKAMGFAGKALSEELRGAVARTVVELSKI